MSTQPQNNQTQPKPPLTKRWFRFNQLVIASAISAILGIIVGAAIAIPLSYSSGVNKQMEATTQAQIIRKNDEYQKAQKKLDDIDREYEEAKAVIAGAKKYNVDNLKSQSEKLSTEIESQKKELDELEGKVESAKKNTIGNGTWQVGKDVQPGRYRVTEEVHDTPSKTCAIFILENNDYVDSLVPEGGFPEFTVKDGQELRISGCPTFTKIG